MRERPLAQNGFLRLVPPVHPRRPLDLQDHDSIDSHVYLDLRMPPTSSLRSKLQSQLERAGLVPNHVSRRNPNKRRYPRYDLDTEIKATMLALSGQEVAQGRCLNINEGGIGGAFATGWVVGTRVNLRFSVPSSTVPLLVQGVLRNRTSHCYGFEFVDLSAEQRGAIARTCRTLALLD
jgi:hypothetical protein